MIEDTKEFKQAKIEICPVDGAICDRKCGYSVHGTIKRANKILDLPEDPADANVCEGCQ